MWQEPSEVDADCVHFYSNYSRTEDQSNHLHSERDVQHVVQRLWNWLLCIWPRTVDSCKLVKLVSSHVIAWPGRRDTHVWRLVTIECRPDASQREFCQPRRLHCRRSAHRHRSVRCQHHGQLMNIDDNGGQVCTLLDRANDRLVWLSSRSGFSRRIFYCNCFMIILHILFSLSYRYYDNCSCHCSVITIERNIEQLYANNWYIFAMSL